MMGAPVPLRRPCCCAANLATAASWVSLPWSVDFRFAWRGDFRAIGNLDAGQCNGGTLERLEASHRGAVEFDRSMILLN